MPQYLRHVELDTQVNRSEFQVLARSRLQDAAVLHQAGRFDGAYYLFGLAVECGLKACISRKTRRYDFPDRDLALKSHQHELSRLVEAAGLGTVLDGAMKDVHRLSLSM